MRVCIVGGGLAGTLLAWRLAHATTGWQVELVPGEQAGARTGPKTDATAASGGAVRAFEDGAEQRRLATVSMVELLGSRIMRQWADYRPARFVSLRRSEAGLAEAIADIELMLPGSAEVVGAAALAEQGWADLHDGAVAVAERSAGYTSPGRWRDALLADARRRVSVLDAPVTAVTPQDDGTVAVTAGGRDRDHDVVVVAAGPWTPGLLRASGLPSGGYRTKSIQYAVHPVTGWAGGWPVPQFMDEVSGLYGRPTADGGLLLGLPTELWDVDPDRPPVTTALLDTAARLASARFPRLRLGPATCRVGSADCYAEQPILALRSVIDTGHRLFTFSGGAGGSVKTALAASHRAAIQLVESGHHFELTSVGRRKGQP
jgi:glycine/D-amino acid oxidase-like deaminating enzyme